MKTMKKVTSSESRDENPRIFNGRRNINNSVKVKGLEPSKKSENRSEHQMMLRGNPNINDNRRGQEEMVGFILLVIMVLVVGATLLFLMKPKQSQVSIGQFQQENLIASVMGATVGNETIAERIGDCEKHVGCDELKSDMNDMMAAIFSKTGFVLGQNLKGYSLDITGGMDYHQSFGNGTQKSVGASKIVKNSIVKITLYS